MLRERDGQVEGSGADRNDEGWWASLLQSDNGRATPPIPKSVSAMSAEASTDDWDVARTLYFSDGTVDLDVVGFNRGGLLVVWNTLRGFVPASHLVEFPNDADELARKNALSRRVGEHLHLKVIEVDEGKGRIVFSERAARSAPGSRDQLLSRLQIGDVIAGLVTNVCDFGAFVDLGGVEGLIHVSEISWNRVNHPRDVLENNRSVDVMVMSIDREQARVALSLKRTRPDPWSTVDERYSVGQVVEGEITNVVNFGAFISLEDGLEGLIHISELAEGHFMHPRNVVIEGETVQARIMSIDPHNRRLSLSLRRNSAEHLPI
jgi:small subunit ribosomal protein S1